MTLAPELALPLGLMASQALQPSLGAGPAHASAGSGMRTQLDDVREPWLPISPREVALLFEGATLSFGLDNLCREAAGAGFADHAI